MMIVHTLCHVSTRPHPPLDTIQETRSSHSRPLKDRAASEIGTCASSSINIAGLTAEALRLGGK